MKKLLLPFFLAVALPAHAQVDCLEAKIDDSYLIPGRVETVVSKHHYIIINLKPYPVTYTHLLQLCADEYECETRVRSKTLAPGEKIDFRTQVKSDIGYGRPGLKRLKAVTSIGGGEQGYIEKISTAYVRVQ